MKRFEYRIQGTERVIYESDEFYRNTPLINREFLYKNVKDKDSKYEIYDTLFKKVLYREGDEKNYPSITLTREQQKMLEDIIILENAIDDFDKTAEYTSNREDINEEVREHIRKGYARNRRKCEKELKKKWLEYEYSLGGIENVSI